MAMRAQQHETQQQQDLLLGAAGATGLNSSAAGKALLENREVRVGRLVFKDAVRTVIQICDVPTPEVAALIDGLNDALADASVDTLELRAAFFLGCSLLTGGGGTLAQRLDLLTALSAAFGTCLVRDSRTALRSYRLLRSAALAAAASLDSAQASRGKRNDTDDIPGSMLFAVQDVVSMPIAAQSPCAAACEETVGVLMQRALEPALPSLRKVVVSIFGACIAAGQPHVASRVLDAVSLRWKQSGGSKALEAAAITAGDLILQCAGVSRDGTAMCSVFLGSMLTSVFDGTLPAAAVRHSLQLVVMCTSSGACLAQDAMSVMLAVSSGKPFDAQTRAVAVRLAGSIASRPAASQASRFIDQMTRLIEEQRWHTETKTVRLEVLKSVGLVASKVLGTPLASHSLTVRLARQLHFLLAEVLTYDPTDIEQFIVALCRTLTALPTEQVKVASLMTCMLPLQQHTEVQPDAVHQLLALAASCLTVDSTLSRHNWQALASVSVSERQALRRFVCGLRKLYPTEIDEAVAVRPIRRFVDFIETDSDQPYENIHELQLLAVCADAFAEATRDMLNPLCIHLQKSPVTNDSASTACVLQILKAAVRKFPETRARVMAIFNDETAISTFIKFGLHTELLSIIWTTHNRRKNSLNLVESVILAAAEPMQTSLFPVLDLCGELALCFCDYQKDKMEKVTADYREGMDAHEPEHGEHDDDFNYMTREERRREDVEAIEEGVSSIVFKGGPLHRFIPMITNMLAHNLPVEASPAAVNAQASAVVALGKFMVNSRQLAEGQVDLISDVLARSHHACVKHAALSVLADMTMFIPNHPTLHQEDGQCFLTELLDDELLGRAALHQLLRLCNIRVVHAAAHLGALAAAMQYDSNVAIVKAFFASYLRTTGKQGRSTKETRARVIYKTYCDLPSKLSTEHKQNVMLQLITSFCDLGVEKELTTLLAKRLIEHVDATAASLLYERRTAAVYAVPGVVTQVEQRNLAALVVRISVAKDKLLSDLDRSELQHAACVTQSLYKLLSLPSAQKMLSATNRTIDRSAALIAATKHLRYVADQIATALDVDVANQGETDIDPGGMSCSEKQAASSDRLPYDHVNQSTPHTRRSEAALGCAKSIGRSSVGQAAAPTDRRTVENTGVVYIATSRETKLSTLSGSELYSKIREILRAADSSTLTKKKIRSLLADEISTEFVEANKDPINRMVVDATKQHLGNTDSAQASRRSVEPVGIPASYTPTATANQVKASVNQDTHTSEALSSSERLSPRVGSPDSPCNGSGWSGMEEEEEQEQEFLADSGVQDSRMHEFLEAAVAVARSAVKRSADCMSATTADGAKGHDSQDGSRTASKPAAKRLHLANRDDGDARTDDSLSLGSALDVS